MPTTMQFPSGSHVVVQATPASFDPSTTLCVAAAYSNPQHWKSRRRLFEEFRAYMSGLPNVRLFVGELAYGKDRFEVTSAKDPSHLQLRAEQVLWHKENILNLVISQRLPANWQYGAYVDADFHFSRHDIAGATIKLLQSNDWVQMFSDYGSLDCRQRAMSNDSGFAWCRKAGKKFEGNPQYGDVEVGATGGAWAFRRDAYDAVGGLMDFAITGSADWHMTFGLYGHGNPHPELKACFPGYVKAILNWQSRAFKTIKRGIGYVEAHALHYWHGPIISRAYGTRWQVLKDHQFDPATDLYRNSQGVLQVTPSKRPIADGILKYFAARNEDADA